MKPWDRMTPAEPLARSAQIAAEECERQGVPLIASDEQHRAAASALWEAQPEAVPS